MAVQGPMTWIDRALKKIADGTISLTGDTFHAVLLNSSQAVSATFTGSSGDARYADLTGELSTANGYTIGGVALTGQALARPAVNQTSWTTALATWTLSGSITVKYFAIVDWTATNKDLVGFMDYDIGGGTVTLAPPTYALNADPTLGWLAWQQ